MKKIINNQNKDKDGQKKNLSAKGSKKKSNLSAALRKNLLRRKNVNSKIKTKT